MVNEEKLKEEIELARLDTNDGKAIENLRTFYKSDYISKEFLKSFFSGSIAFVLIAILGALKNSENLMNTINSIDYESMALQFVTLYLAFMAIYFLVTYLVYALRYFYENRKLKKYRAHLKKLDKIYSRDERP